MAGNIQNVSFSSPQALLAPDLSVQQQQIQRQEQLAQTLREMSLTEDRVDPGSRVSWTQGLARIAEALAANRAYKKSDERQMAINQAYAARLGGGRSPFAAGGPTLPGTGPTIDESGAAPGSPTMAPSMRMPIPNAPIQSAPIPPSSAEQAPVSAAQPDQGAPPPQQQQMQPPGPLSLSGDPQRDMMQYGMAPEEYMKAVIASHTPGDLAKMMIQAGIDPNGPLGHQILQANITKQNYIAPISARPGGAVLDPNDPSHVLFQGATAPVGGAVDYQNGQPVAMHTIPGAPGVIAASEAAKAGGAATYKPMTAFDPTTGAPIITTDAIAANAAAGGRPMAAGPALGAGAFADTASAQGAKYFADLQTKAAPINNQVYGLRQILGLSNSPTVFGPGSEAAVKTAGVLNQVGQAFGVPSSFNNTNVTSQQEMNKWAGQVAAQAAGAMGLNGSDARFNIALESNPSGHMTNSALKSMVPQIIGLAQGVAGQAQAGARYAAQHPGPNAQGEFQSLWNKNYDPAIYTHMAQGPQAFAGWVKSLTPAQAAAVRSKYVILKQYGALPE